MTPSKGPGASCTRADAGPPRSPLLHASRTPPGVARSGGRVRRPPSGRGGPSTRCPRGERRFRSARGRALGGSTRAPPRRGRLRSRFAGRAARRDVRIELSSTSPVCQSFRFGSAMTPASRATASRGGAFTCPREL
jgi:hypothetical protein